MVLHIRPGSVKVVLEVWGVSTLETHNPTHRSGAPQSDSDTGCLYLHRSDPPSYIYIYNLLAMNQKMRLEDKDV